MKEEIEGVINWIHSYVENTVAKGLVLGLSGGLDSSVVAALSVEAIGKDKVLGNILPCQSDSQDKEDALVVANYLGIETIELDLTPTFNKLFNSIYNIFRKLPLEMTSANIKARLRMIVQYAFASEKNYLVIGTGNKTELLLGYVTKYGDGGVDIEPLGDFYKTEVFQMAREIAKIPGKIIEKAPSAGLWRGQTDEGEIGMSYMEIDKILKDLEKDIMSDDPSYQKIYNMVEKNRHKNQIPPRYERSKK